MARRGSFAARGPVCRATVRATVRRAMSGAVPARRRMSAGVGMAACARAAAADRAGVARLSHGGCAAMARGTGRPAAESAAGAAARVAGTGRAGVSAARLSATGMSTAGMSATGMSATGMSATGM